MRRILAFALVFSFFAFPPLCLAEDYSEGLLVGQETARTQVKTTNWFIGGFAGGFFLGIMGGGAAVIAAHGSNAAPDYVLQTTLNGKSNDYRRGFFDGYGKVTREKRVNSALVGSMAGFGAWLLVYSSMDHDSYYAARPAMVVSF